MTDPIDISFEQSLEKIRTIVADLERGELSLEDSLDQYREGSELIDHARKLIADAELRVRVLSDADPQDQPDA